MVLFSFFFSFSVWANDCPEVRVDQNPQSLGPVPVFNQSEVKYDTQICYAVTAA
ncbi:MAG: hypothetical protein ACK5RO_07410 [Pseudobdellovibrionaceae bacterium]